MAGGKNHLKKGVFHAWTSKLTVYIRIKLMTNYKIKGRRCIHIIVLTIFYLIPVLFLEEINKGFGGILFSKSIDIRFIKELGMVLIVPLSFFYSVSMGRLNKYYPYLLFLLLFLSFPIIASYGEPNDILICGLRWILPLILPVFLYGYVDDIFMKKCYQSLTIIFIVHVFLQILELFFMPPYNGYTYFGLTARVPGITSHPHASAYFVCSYYLLMIGFEENKKRVVLGSILVVISILLSMSSTGVIAITLLIMLYRFRKTHWKTILFIAPFMAISLFTFADIITNRSEGSSQRSISDRQSLYSDVLSNSSLISTNFGYATNGAFRLSEKNGVKIKETMFADSFYTSILGNMGIIFIIIFIIMIIRLYAYLITNNLVYPLLFLIFYSLFAVSEILTEVFPGNLILPIVIAYFLNKNNRRRYVK